MLKKTITFEDFDGNMRTEEFYFNLTKAELVQLELSEKKGLAETLKDIVASNDGATIVKKFQEIILLSYGIKSEDGRRFIKTPELRDEFAQTAAYSELFIELATDADAAAKFVKGIVPQTGMAPGTLDLIAPTSDSPAIPKVAPAPIASVSPLEASMPASEPQVVSPPVMPAHNASMAPKTREQLLAELAALPPEEDSAK